MYAYIYKYYYSMPALIYWLKKLGLGWNLYFLNGHPWLYCHNNTETRLGDDNVVTFFELERLCTANFEPMQNRFLTWYCFHFTQHIHIVLAMCDLFSIESRRATEVWKLNENASGAAPTNHK